MERAISLKGGAENERAKVGAAKGTWPTQDREREIRSPRFEESKISSAIRRERRWGVK